MWAEPAVETLQIRHLNPHEPRYSIFGSSEVWGFVSPEGWPSPVIQVANEDLALRGWSESRYSRICGVGEAACRCVNAPDHDGPHRCACSGSWEYDDEGLVVVSAPGGFSWDQFLSMLGAF